MIIDCVSDLHGFYPELEGGDLLIIAGDLTDNDSRMSHHEFQMWLASQKYEKKIVIAGNHDNFIHNHLKEYGVYGFDKWVDAEYLCDSGTEFEGLKIWGSPWTRSFYGMNPKCMAFTLDTDSKLKEKFDLIPNDIDILITHSPPEGILDSVCRYDYRSTTVEYCGSNSLRRKLLNTSLKLHVFGHIHEHGGKKEQHGETTYINASIMNEVYDPVNKPVRVIL